MQLLINRLLPHLTNSHPTLLGLCAVYVGSDVVLHYVYT